MKKILFALVALAISVSASANITVYGGVSKVGAAATSLDLGFGAGANYFIDKGAVKLGSVTLKDMKFGVDASYTISGGTGFSYNVIEIMPIARSGKKIFWQAGIGLALSSLSFDANSAFDYNSTNLSIMGGAGYNIDEMFVVDGRVKLVDGSLGFGVNFGYKF